eukprot:Nk52_evm5s179 gene=Nk52_evmTU5s179
MRRSNYDAATSGDQGDHHNDFVGGEEVINRQREKQGEENEDELFAQEEEVEVDLDFSSLIIVGDGSSQEHGVGTVDGQVLHGQGRNEGVLETLAEHAHTVASGDELAAFRQQWKEDIRRGGQSGAASSWVPQERQEIISDSRTTPSDASTEKMGQLSSGNIGLSCSGMMGREAIAGERLLNGVREGPAEEQRQRPHLQRPAEGASKGEKALYHYMLAVDYEQRKFFKAATNEYRLAFQYDENVETLYKRSFLQASSAAQSTSQGRPDGEQVVPDSLSSDAVLNQQKGASEEDKTGEVSDREGKEYSFNAQRMNGLAYEPLVYYILEGKDFLGNPEECEKDQVPVLNPSSAIMGIPNRLRCQKAGGDSDFAIKTHISVLPVELLEHTISFFADVSSYNGMACVEALGATCRFFFVLTRTCKVWKRACRRAFCPESLSMRKGSALSAYIDHIQLKPSLSTDLEKACAVFSGNWRRLFITSYLPVSGSVYVSHCRYERAGERGLEHHYQPYFIVDYYRIVRFFGGRAGIAMMVNSADPPEISLKKMKSYYPVLSPSFQDETVTIGPYFMDPHGNVEIFLQKPQAFQNTISVYNRGGASSMIPSSKSSSIRRNRGNKGKGAGGIAERSIEYTFVLRLKIDPRLGKTKSDQPTKKEGIYSRLRWQKYECFSVGVRGSSYSTNNRITTMVNDSEQELTRRELDLPPNKFPPFQRITTPL